MRVSVGDFKLGDDEYAAIGEVLDSGRISEGIQVRKFEEEFARFVGTRFCVATSSGTAALICGWHSLVHDKRFPRIKRGAKVLVSPITYISTVNAIVLSGLEPVFVDIDPKTFSLLPEEVEKAFRSNDQISGILPVHLMGYPNDMDALTHIADTYDAVVFEDSAQAHGSIYKGKKTGSFSICADYSFYIAHNIQAGEMGAIVTDDEDLWKMIKKMKTNGRLCACKECVRHMGLCPYKDKDFDPRFTHDVIAYNFKTMDFQAALARVQLKKVDWIMSRRQKNVEYLNASLGKYSDIFRLPLFSKDVSYLAYPIVINDEKIQRQSLMRELEQRGIETRPLFGCIPTQQPAYAHLANEYKSKLPNADYVGRHGFYIGCHQYLEDDDLDYIIGAFDEVING